MLGKRFCKQCGAPAAFHPQPPLAAESAGSLPPAESVDEAMKPPEATADEPVPAAERSVAGAETPWVDMESFAPKTIPIPEWEPVSEVGQIPPVSSEAHAESIPSFPQPKRKIGLAIGIAAAVLAAAGGGWAWYAHSHQGISSEAKSSAATPQSTAQGGTSATPGATAQPVKPPAGTAIVAVAGAPPNAPQSVPTSGPVSAAPNQPPSSSQSRHGNPVAPTPVFSAPQAPSITPPPPRLPAAQARSGVRYYQGPPVPYGGTVVFDNLPKARLKFTFDHAAWQLILKTNPDGTKKAILNSLKQGYQTNCDLGWEIIE
jgi:hypothetical protein